MTKDLAVADRPGPALDEHAGLPGQDRREPEGDAWRSPAVRVSGRGARDERQSTDLPDLRRYPLARRGFVMTSLISGFTLATERVDAQAIHTDAAGLEAREVQIPVSGGHLPAYCPASGRRHPSRSSW